MFNPLDKENLGKSVAEALQRQDIEPLPPSTPFQGAGAYAVYYTGQSPTYRRLSTINKREQCVWPIYVGKADPQGSRKGTRGQRNRGTPLFTRLGQHTRSIDQVRSLKLDDFCCRYLVVDEIWIALTESMLIDQYSPLWNTSLEGFGIHDPGAGRRVQRRSPWDTVHPGRPWAKMQSLGRQSAQELRAQIESALMASLQRRPDP